MANFCWAVGMRSGRMRLNLEASASPETTKGMKVHEGIPLCTFVSFVVY
jgi:hypothetical protein